MNLLSFKKKKFLVIGDIILDKYIFGEIKSISHEAPVPVFSCMREKNMLGGAGNVAKNLSGMGQEVFLMGVVGKDEAGEAVFSLAEKAGISTDYTITLSSKATTVKTRLLADNNQHVLKIDNEDKTPIDESTVSEFEKHLKGKIKDFDAVIISDYMKGMCTVNITRTVIDLCIEKDIPVFVDPKDSEYEKYVGCTLIKPNEKEFISLINYWPKTEQAFIEACSDFKSRIKSEYLLVTRASKGMVFFDKNNEMFPFDATAREICDVTGAGDTVLAFVALCFTNGICDHRAVKIANTAAGIKVGKVGTAAVTPDEVENELNLDISKVKTPDEIEMICNTCRLKKRRIVFTNGCFDILHAGHVAYLKLAKSMGDILIVGVNSDASITGLKGKLRPIIGEKERINLLRELSFIDYIVKFDEDTPRKLIKAVKPDLLIKGGDYKLEEVVGKEIVEAYGGKVEVLPFFDSHSTTGIINKIIGLYSNKEDSYN